MDKKILDKVNSPQDVKKLNKNELTPLCEEIREVLIDTLSKNGGHLSSNLGTVELTVALHRIFDSPKDQIVWDVGHQSYTHKILTGRKDRLSTLRTKGGLSGFPRPKESEHDAFIAGHSSTSLAAAYGLARAKSIKGEDGHVIAVIGDGAASGGMFYEGINNIGRAHDRLIIVLNDNKVSISKNIGAIAKYLSDIRVRPKYFRIKDKIDHFIGKIPKFGKWIRNKIVKSKSMVKHALYHMTWFEEFGIAYLGPVDGHDIKSLCQVLKRAKEINKPVLVHVETVKGKGYKYAEENPGAYHGVTPFNPDLGHTDNKTSDGFSEAFGKILTELGKNDNKICAISPAMKYACGLDVFAKTFPRRFLDVGIAEPLAITCAAGMAKNGLLPVVAIYSSFLQRAYDQVLHDAAIDNTHIVLAIDRAGIVGNDGETHQGVFDVAFLSTIPGVKIYSPSDFDELKMCLNKAIYEDDGVVAVRYPKGKPTILDEKFRLSDTNYSHYISENAEKNKNIVITYGREYWECAKAVQSLENDGIFSDILKLTSLQWSDEIYNILSKYEKVFFVEECVQRGSISELFAVKLSQNNFNGKYYSKTIGNRFIEHQTIMQALEECELDSANIYKFIKENI